MARIRTKVKHPLRVIQLQLSKVKGSSTPGGKKRPIRRLYLRYHTRGCCGDDCLTWVLSDESARKSTKDHEWGRNSLLMRCKVLKYSLFEKSRSATRLSGRCADLILMVSLVMLSQLKGREGVCGQALVGYQRFRPFCGPILFGMGL